MSIQKIYRKYGKRTLASILAILLSVQTPLLSYADTNDFEISSYDDVAERPVWDDSYSVDDSNEFDSSIFELGANKISNLSNRELEPLSQNEIDYIFEHVNDSSEINMPVIDVADHDNEISTQSVVAVTASVAALILIMLAGYSSAVSANQPAGNLDYYIRSYAEDDSFNELISYIKNNVAYSVRLNVAMVKTLISKLDNCAKGNGYSLTLTDEDKQVLAYALKNRGLLTFLDPENVNVKAIDGYQYYYIYTDTKEYMKPYYVYVLYTPDSVAFAQKNTSYSSLSNQFQFYKYNPLLASDFKYEPMKYYIGKYMLSSATGLYEFDSGVAYTGSGKSGIAKFGDYNYTCFPFTVTSDLSGSSKEDKFQNYFTVKSALLLDIAYCGRVVSGSALMNLENVSSTKDISEYTSMPKNFYGQVTGLNKAAGIVNPDATDSGTTTKPGTDSGGGSGSTTTDTENTGILKQLLTLITSMESALKALSIGSIGALLTVDFINALAKSSFISGITTLLSSISTGVNNIANWDIDNWAEYSASILASLKSIDNIETLIGNIADFTMDNFPDVLESSLSSLGFADIVNMANVLKIWNIDTVGETIVASINNALSKLGLATIPKDIVSFKESVDSKLIESTDLLTAIKNALGSLTVSPDLSGLSDILKNVLTALGLGFLLGAVTNIGEIVKGMSFVDIIAAIKALPASIAAEIAKVIPSQGDSDNENQNDSGFSNFLNLFMITLLILVILIILFINCLRFIVLVFNIPASTTLLPDDILTGIQYLKDLQLPLFGVSLYTLLLSCAYFIIFMTVIMTLRRKIDKIHI